MGHFQDTTEDQKKFYNDLYKLVTSYHDRLSPLEVAAVIAILIGYIVALQEEVPPEVMIETVMRNIEYGNNDTVQKMALTEQAPAGSA